MGWVARATRNFVKLCSLLKGNFVFIRTWHAWPATRFRFCLIVNQRSKYDGRLDEDAGKKRRKKKISIEQKPFSSRDHNGDKCYGCGEVLQINDPSLPGFVDAEKYDLKKRHKQLNTLLCVRCQSLSHGAMIPGVADFAQTLLQGDPLSRQALSRQKENEYRTLSLSNIPASNKNHGVDYSKHLATPDEMRKRLHGLHETRAVIVLLIDLLDASGSILNRIRDIVGSNPIIAIGTKFDLLPKGTKALNVEDWLQDLLSFKKISVISTHIVSSKTNEGLAQAVAAIRQERRGRDVYVIGAANVGKSAFIRSLVKEMTSMGSKQFDPAAISKSKHLPVESAMPGTTLQLIPLEVFYKGGTLFDTPGLHLHHRVLHMLTPEENKELHPRHRLREFIAPSTLDLLPCSELADSTTGTDHDLKIESSAIKGKIYENIYDCDYVVSYWWGGLVRVDIRPSASTGILLHFYGPHALRVTYSVGDERIPSPISLRSTSEEDQECYGLKPQENHGIVAPIGAFGAISATRRGGYKCMKSFNLQLPNARERDGPIADIAVSGIPGWISVHFLDAKSDNGKTPINTNARLRYADAVIIDVWTPIGIEAYLRTPIPVP